ncbi:ScyD/ScyE family protein [Nocardioides sp. GY 10113]|uniref:ScyD/ScyE family protein n=1 Tax=Nocardioides sp. GY 10113 TaxID=2569761 RepID=UPI0010A7E363|nr:ScyD/ScyE family protein [Nocardioides sp. GY 10113]TIC86770.1 ScyD/ScyE family protein [Nocardioides sp. GY 10113]
MRLSRIPLAAVAVALGATTLSPAQAAPPPAEPATLAGGLISPLRAAIANDGTAYVSQNFAGQLLKVRRGAEPRVVYQAAEPGAEVGAVSVLGKRVVFAITPAEEMPEEPVPGGAAPRLSAGAESPATPSASVMVLKRGGKARVLADVGAFEAAHNPDGDVTYGFSGLDEECAAQLPPFLLPYQGEAYSHPYATAATPRTTYLADAGANDVVAISPSGRVREVAVLPAVKVVATPEVIEAAAAAEVPLPECVLGKEFTGEPVPTDIEVGRDGFLYVTTLGGGIGEILPVGAIHRINPRTGAVRTLVTGLAAPTGLALTPRGAMYATELFAGRIVKIYPGSSRVWPFAEAPTPAEVEMNGWRLYATVNALAEEPAGELVRYR